MSCILDDCSEEPWDQAETGEGAQRFLAHASELLGSGRGVSRGVVSVGSWMEQHAPCLLTWPGGQAHSELGQWQATEWHLQVIGVSSDMHMNLCPISSCQDSIGPLPAATGSQTLVGR